MKFLRNIKEIGRKILIAISIVVLFQFGSAKPVQASDDWGGVLLDPIISLITSLGDGILSLIHRFVMGQQQAYYKIDTTMSILQKIISVVVGILVGIAVVAAVVLTLGSAGALLAGVLPALASTITAVTTTVAIVLGVAAGLATGASVYYADIWPDQLILPLYSISPEEIFRGNILLFDVDFFNPQDEIYVKTASNSASDVTYHYKYTTKEDRAAFDGTGESGAITATAIEDGHVYSPGNEKVRYYYYVDDNGEEVITSKQNVALDLQQIVAQWYVAIRNVVIVLMMSVLLYIGIRMMLTVVAAEKAKYRQMLVDWLVSICLVFLMHYIMAFSVSIVKSFTAAVDSATQTQKYTPFISLEKDGDIYKRLFGNGDDSLHLDPKDYIVYADEAKTQEVPAMNDKGQTDTSNPPKYVYLCWPTNLMGSFRLSAQTAKAGTDEFIGTGLGFFILVLLTVFFVFTYLKRVLYMAFLTMIAPLVALTYPIDKISDGQAQAFNKWLKEYVFNLLIQPLHLLLYTILVSSALELSLENAIYTLVAIGFMIPAEKLLRSFFGFEKASTAGSLAGAAVGASLVSTGLNKLINGVRGHGGAKGANGKANGQIGDEGNNGRIGYNNQFDKNGVLAANLPESGNGGQDPDSEYASQVQAAGWLDDNPENFAGGGQLARRDPDSEYASQVQAAGWLDDNPENFAGGGQLARSNSDSEYASQVAAAGWLDDNDNENNATEGGQTVGQPQNVQGPANTNSVRISQPQTQPPRPTQIQAQTPTQAEPQNLTKRKKVLRLLKRTGNAIGTGMRYKGRNIKENFRNNMKNNLNLAKASPRLAMKGFATVGLAGLAGVVGTAAAVASGDAGNVLQWGGGATVAGAAAGSALISGRPRQPNEIGEAMTKELYGGEEAYSRKQAQRREKQFKNDAKNRLGKYLTKEEIDALYRSSEYQDGNGNTLVGPSEIDQILEKGDITDIKDIATIHKLVEDGTANNIDHAIAISKDSTRKGDYTKLSRKSINEWNDTTSAEFQNRGYNKEDSDQMAKSQERLWEKYYKVRNKL